MKAGSRWCALVALFSIGAGTTTPAAAQDPRGLSFVAGVAYEWDGPGPSLVREMTAAGFADEKPKECYGTICVFGTQYPFYHDEGLNLAGLFGVRYRFDAPFSVELQLSNSLRGQAEGYNLERGDYLAVTYSSILLTTGLAAHIGPLRLEAGPVWNRTAWGVVRTRRHSGEGTTVTIARMVSASLGFVLREATVAVKGGVRENPTVDLDGPIQIELYPRYRTYFLGITVAPPLN